MTLSFGALRGGAGYSAANNACHRLDCQTWSGSEFIQRTFLLETLLGVTRPLVVYELIVRAEALRCSGRKSARFKNI
jgi:hypothetical protein